MVYNGCANALMVKISQGFFGSYRRQKLTYLRWLSVAVTAISEQIQQ